jgi:peptide/nickel transport system ATP-binding protein/oligopeptide transport system ATP-binding protein
MNAPAITARIAATGNVAPVLRVENLKTHLHLKAGILPAVDGISFSLRPGETLGIVGESGCGKSMTALSIMRLLPWPVGRIAEGSIEIAGVGDITNLSSREMKAIRGNEVSMIFQEPMTSLNPVFRVGFQIQEAIRVHQKVGRAEARERAIEMLKLVRIPLPEERSRNYPHQMSGGMRQRVMIAMALACRPKVMLADEPTTALDVTIQAQILKLMNQVKDEVGTSFILITHDLGVIARMVQRVLVMYAGVVVEEADVRSLFAEPLHPYTKGLLNSIPRIDTGAGRKQKLDTIQGTVPNLLKLPKGCRFSDRCPAVHDPCLKAEPPLALPDDRPTTGRKVRCWLYRKPD